MCLILKTWAPDRSHRNKDSPPVNNHRWSGGQWLQWRGCPYPPRYLLVSKGREINKSTRHCKPSPSKYQDICGSTPPKKSLGHAFTGLLEVHKIVNMPECDIMAPAHAPSFANVHAPSSISDTEWAYTPQHKNSIYTIRDVYNPFDQSCSASSENRCFWINTYQQDDLYVSRACKRCWTFGSILIAKVVSDRLLNPSIVRLRLQNCCLCRVWGHVHAWASWV